MTKQNGPLDPQVLDELRTEMGDADYMRDLIDTYLDETPALVAKIRDAAARHDAGSLAKVAHTLKSTSATFGATDLARLLADIETLCRANQEREAVERVPEVDVMYEQVRRALQQERG